MKIIAISSSGGHEAELKKLILRLELTNQEVIYAIENSKEAKYNLPSSKRENKIKFLINFLILITKSIIIVIKEKPDAVITTGSNTTVPLAYIMNKLNKKIMYIESIARVKTKSKTGKILEKYKNCTIFVQWEEMVDIYSNAKFIGRVL